MKALTGVRTPANVLYMNTYRVTVTVQSLNYTNTLTVKANNEVHAQGVAMGECLMPNGKRSDLRLRGALVEYDVKQMA